MNKPILKRVTISNGTTIFQCMYPIEWSEEMIIEHFYGYYKGHKNFERYTTYKIVKDE